MLIVIRVIVRIVIWISKQFGVLVLEALLSMLEADTPLTLKGLKV